MFTRQHYKAIAGIIARNRTKIGIEDVEQLSRDRLPCLHPSIIGDIADYFAAGKSYF